MAEPGVGDLAAIMLLFHKQQPAGCFGNAEQYHHGDDAEQWQQDIVPAGKSV